MKNKLKFIPFLLAVPLLFMANSPVPGPDYYEYSDYEISDLVFEEADENGKYPFSTHIKNTGNNYISLADSYLGGGHRFTNEYYASGLCIAPHSEGTYVSRDNVVNKFSLDEVKFVCYAYESHGFAQYSDIEFVSKKMENDWTKYTFHANDYQTPEQTRYGKLITVSIKGEKMCIFQIVGNDDISIWLFDDSLEADDFVFESIALTKYRQSNGFPNIQLDDIAIVVFRWIVYVILIAAGVVAVSAAIFLPTFFGIRKKRRANAQIPPSENDKKQ